MMNKTQEWLEEILNNCYKCKVDGDIIWVYDKNYIRKLKLSQIENIETKTPNQTYFKKILFYQDNKNKIFECDYDQIWRNININLKTNPSIFIKNTMKLKNFLYRSMTPRWKYIRLFNNDITLYDWSTRQFEFNCVGGVESINLNQLTKIRQSINKYYN